MNDFKGFDHGTDPIDLRMKQFAIELLPTEIHHKVDGSIDHQPSICIVMTNLQGFYCYGQLSLEMWNKGLTEIGYKIQKL